MQPSPEPPTGANFPALPLSKRAKRRWRRHQLVLYLLRPEYDRLRSLRPRFGGESPPKIARHLLLLALSQIEQIEQQPLDLPLPLPPAPAPEGGAR